jgi:opacity protein-like surface antigen
MRKALRRSLFLSLLLAFALPIAWTPAAHGQVELKPGLRVGFNSATFTGDTDKIGDEIVNSVASTGFAGSVEVTEKRRSGFTAGGFLVVDFAGPFAIQPELRYIQRGYIVETELTSGLQTATVEQTFRFNYIDIAALGRYDIPVGGFTPYLIAGPTLGFNVNAEVESDISSGTSNQTETTDASDETNGTDFGLELGTGAEFGLGGTALSVDGRVGIGISDVNNENDEITLRNGALILTAGITF